MVRRMEEFEQAINEIKILLELFPSGIDYEADPADRSPEDTTAHTAGLIWQVCQRVMPDEDD